VRRDMCLASDNSTGPPCATLLRPCHTALAHVAQMRFTHGATLHQR
jgi:hypothetical protein